MESEIPRCRQRKLGLRREACVLNIMLICIAVTPLTARNYDGNHLFKIASGASGYDYNWTKVLMDRVGGRMNGLSLIITP